jgi:hypothetical protein
MKVLPWLLQLERTEAFRSKKITIADRAKAMHDSTVRTQFKCVT